MSILISSDRKALLFLLVMALGAVAAFWWLGSTPRTNSLQAADSIAGRPVAGSGYGYRGWDDASVGHYQGGSRSSKGTGYYDASPGRQPQYFPFDPNTADSTQLLRLGLSPYQVRNIYKYRAAGGIFRYPEDFARLYGLTVAQYQALRPYIRIAGDYRMAADVVERPTRHSASATPSGSRDTVTWPRKLKPSETIVLNTADTNQLKRVPGIGSYWARRIVSYGDQLGGYVDVRQLSEIEDFPEETLPYFVVQAPRPRRLKVNTLSVSQLRRHPYINFYQARAIYDYRRLKGNLESLEQLRLLPDFPPEAIQRLAPYVDF